ncbi:CCQ_1a_G0041040.mRNA.1.CDS.1 [Saccharomyces cerevisiae]|uniref:Transcription factor-like protein euc1 n=1 Tax=Saccharomyces pastorianus TaxID=27292 RepID=A0A6C1DZE4_SACPS|nr:hypothetical protein H757_YJM450M00255 [Saccharomyces cerevisiae YJM450]AJS89036.1 hypothetical protein H808_YJM1388M00256 [Saccharomyces cerevisiae YJM1388]AJS96438.1 hypothetical protein H825_YJM1460M00256 [Saccharomyces cerevisiae YJM1460]QID81624.1 Transcription factor-like protein euc1 [Saccharomyces pastorianus]CAD6640282.1 BJ4_G0021960.mRNA.1.CDS.1 [Saccharomyces cerevisiae]
MPAREYNYVEGFGGYGSLDDDDSDRDSERRNHDLGQRTITTSPTGVSRHAALNRYMIPGRINPLFRPTDAAQPPIVSTSTSASATEPTNRIGPGRIKETPETNFNAFLIAQLTRMEEQNANLKEEISLMKKEQELFFLENQKKLEKGFKDINKYVEDVSAMKEVFKEVVGIMTGERIRFIDHTGENVTPQEAARVGNPSTSTQAHQSQSRSTNWQEYSMHASILAGDPRIKPEPGLSDFENGEYDGNESDENATTRNLPLNNPDSVSNADDSNNQLDGTGNENDIRNRRGCVGTSYKLNRAIQNVTDAAREYFEGLPGQPSVLSLERRYGSTWRRSAKERTLFTKRMTIIKRIIDIKDDPNKYGLSLPENKISRNQAIKVVENIRLGNNTFKGHHCRLSMSQLYEYFSKKMDKLEDYSLTLKRRGKPRRIFLLEEREARLSLQQPHSIPNSSTGTPEHDQDT